MQILTDANIVRETAHINVGDAFLLQLCAQRGVGELFVVPEHAIRVDLGIRAFVHFHALIDDLAPCEEQRNRKLESVRRSHHAGGRWVRFGSDSCEWTGDMLDSKFDC
jgi:hypothetical protein